MLKKFFSEKDDFSSVISVNVVTITDNYWVKPIDSTFSYNDVRFSDDYFSGLALNGNYDSFNKSANSKHSRTSELTNIVSFEKCWRLIDGRGRGYIKTLDFTGNGTVNFESSYSFIGDNDDYIENLNIIKIYNPDCVKDYVQMLFLDTICANPDRHTFNYDVLRDIKTGNVLGMAPNFDNNMALIARGYPKNSGRKNDLLVRLFRELIDYDESLKEFISNINEEILKNVLRELDMRAKSKDIITFIMNGYKQATE